MEAAGVEPATFDFSDRSNSGREESVPGRIMSQVGQGQDLDRDAGGTSRTERVLTESDAGLTVSTTEAQRIGTSGRHPSEEENGEQEVLIMKAWPLLPRVIREAILAMVRASIDKL